MKEDTSPDRPGPDGREDENAHIRALLAELGSGPDGRPMPPAVAARLEDTLARLVAERSATGATNDGADHGADHRADHRTDHRADEDASGTVVPLRRRWLPRVTAAAAAVIVVGVGGVAAANLGIFGDAGSMSSDAGGSSGDSQVAESAPESTPATPGRNGLTEEDFGRETAAKAAVPQVSGRSFASDVTALLERRTASGAPSESPSAGSDAGDNSAGDDGTELDTPEEAKQGPGNALRFRSCPGPEITDGAVPNPIRYDGRLAVLLIHPAAEGEQLVEAWTCAGDRRLDSTTLTR